jgi:hypothetical protein
MEQDTVTFTEAEVCEGGAWGMKYGTLSLYPNGFLFRYNKLRKNEPGRMQDAIKLVDIIEISVEKMDWLVSKMFWVGRKHVVIRTREGEKHFYLRHTDNLLEAIKLLNPMINQVDKYKAQP